jgi:hypothetical protein
VYDVAAILIVEWAVPSATRRTSVGLKDAEGALGWVVAVSLTSPEKPLTLFTVIVEVPSVPAGSASEAGLGVMVKLGAAAGNTVTEMARTSDDPPLTPLTVT